jgi:hypothetical protein
MSTCFDPSAEFANADFNAVLGYCNGDPFTPLDWLNMGLLKTIKLIAHKNNVSRTGTKHEIIATIMDTLFPNYPNPLWKYPQTEKQQMLAKMRKRTSQILTHQSRLLEIGVMTEAIHTASSIHSIAIQSLDEFYIGFIMSHRQRYAEYIIRKEKRYQIESILKESEGPKEEDEEDDDCPICYEKLTISNEIQLHCNHRFCEACITSTLSNNTPQCALCRTGYSKFTICSPTVHASMQQHINK